MYSIDINFLNDREERPALATQSTIIQRPSTDRTPAETTLGRWVNGVFQRFSKIIPHTCRVDLPGWVMMSVQLEVCSSSSLLPDCF